MKQRLLTFILISFTYTFAFSQNIDAGTYPGICPGESITLTGTVTGLPPGADDYCPQWVEPNGSTTEGMTITVTPAATTTYTFEVTFNNGDIQTDDVTISVCNLEIHPVAADFNAANVGKALIWTSGTDNNYWTTKKTSKADLPAQSEDNLVHVTVHLTPAADNLGKTVYFRVIDPDLDDESSYEAAGTGDNRDMGVGSGMLSAASDVTTSEMIDGNAVAAAEVELTITDLNAGDNYRVEASLDPAFGGPTQLLETSKLVAWKRVYMEEDQMYKEGATVTIDIAVDADAADDVITVDNTSDFTVGDMIQIFDKDGGFANKTVIAKTAATLTVEDMGAAFVRFSGVRIIGQNDTYSVGTGLFADGFGGDALGTDGGAFVEFDWGHTGSQSIPKYTSFPNDGDVVSFSFCSHWFNNSGGGNNIFQLVAAADHDDGSFGTARDAENICFITTDNFMFGANNPAAITETAVHEIAHLFSVANGHVDTGAAVDNHEATDRCNMSYARTRDNSIVEFDTDCLYDIRDAVVPR